MPIHKDEESFWKKYGHIAGWISLFIAALGLLALISVWPTINFLLTGKPTIVITSKGCFENITDEFHNFLTLKCNELSVGQDENLSRETVSQFNKLPENAISEAKINKATADLCTTFIGCNYNVIANEVITIHDCVSVCVTRAKTNETECHSNC